LNQPCVGIAHEQNSLVAVESAAQAVRCIHGQEALTQHPNAVAQLLGLGQVMRAQEDRAPLLAQGQVQVQPAGLDMTPYVTGRYLAILIHPTASAVEQIEKFARRHASPPVAQSQGEVSRGTGLLCQHRPALSSRDSAQGDCSLGRLRVVWWAFVLRRDLFYYI